jgi:serine/threonine protein kinase
MSFLRNTRKNRRYIKNRNEKINTYKNYTGNLNRKSVAGKPIAEGGFGCVFKPELRCKKNAPDKNYVSKLMLKKNAEEEMKLINIVNKNLTRIPYYAEYFLVKGAYICNPSKLTTGDKKGFNEKCSSLYRKNITQKNINGKLHKLKVINLPYGGLDLDIFWSKWNNLPPSKKKHKSFGVTNICLINLLNRGIKIMNLKDIYHLDLKGSNILRTVSPKNIYITDNVKTRVIDWGLSMRRSNKKTIPIELTDRPFQFNLPFSSILFQSNIQKTVKEYVKKFKQKKDKSDFSNIDGIIKKGLATHIYDTSVYRLGDGHL